MSAHKHVFLFAGTYPSSDEARLDHEVLGVLHGDMVKEVDSDVGAFSDTLAETSAG